MSIPTQFGSTPLQKVYSGDPATSRYRGTATTGENIVIDVIQSVPKRGRWRHVIRISHTAYSPEGVPDSNTVTVTFDNPEKQSTGRAAQIANAALEYAVAAREDVVSGAQ